MKSPQELKDEWYEVNAPYGKELGYPECCIQEFCDQPKELLKGNPTKNDRRRYKAGCISGEFSGFVPCDSHARQIVQGKITLNSLITNRNEDFLPFPEKGKYPPSI